MRVPVGLGVLLAVVAVAAGCGSAGAKSRAGRPTAPVAVIRAWSYALRHGDVNTAASYFALPSTFLDGEPPTVTIHTRAEAEIVNASLPCGARFLSSFRDGRYVNAQFRLTGRPGEGGTDCRPGAGTTARVEFLIKRGKITEWLRAPDIQPPSTPFAPNPGGNPVV
jgi:hypothetical protein